ncbi:hypothetical protein HYV79_03730, partial [Candidatus Woesearchaeota archaeon]|nr:hypothetical protein [Candidatus Woesearchaeota archaeon]
MLKKRKKVVRNSFEQFGTQKYFFILLLLGFAYLSYLVVKPFVTALLSGALLAFISYPIYKYTKKFIKNDGLRASLLTLVIFLVLTLPLI